MSDMISFRHLLAGEVERFLSEEGFSGARIVEAMSELLVQLSRYREEGAPLFPQAFLCRDASLAIARLRGSDALSIGETSLDAEGIRRALKRAAPLGSGGWSIHLEVHGDRLRYGVFRTDMFVLEETAMERLRTISAPDLGMIGVAQLEEHVVLLRGSSGAERTVYLSGARTDARPSPLVVRSFVESIVSGAASELRVPLRRFWNRVLLDAVRLGHGMLVAVIPRDADPATLFADAACITPHVDVGAIVARYLDSRAEESRAAVQGAANLAAGMLCSDGITVLREDGAILAYGAFVAHDSAVDAVLGGARRRTFHALSRRIGHGMVAAFFHSQDGKADVSG